MRLSSPSLKTPFMFHFIKFNSSNHEPWLVGDGSIEGLTDKDDI